MGQPYPLPASTRESAISVGDGVATRFGPFSFKIFEEEDVSVYTRNTLVSGAGFAPTTAVVEKVVGLPFDDFYVTFAAALPATTEFIVRGERLHDRDYAVTKGNQLDPDQMEKEFSKQGTVLQELRRDVDRTVRVPFGRLGAHLLATTAGAPLTINNDGDIISASPVNLGVLATPFMAGFNASADNAGEALDLLGGGAFGKQFLTAPTNAAASAMLAMPVFVNTIAEAQGLDPAVYPVIRRIVNGFTLEYHFDASVGLNAWGNDAQSVFMIPKSYTGTPAGTWVAKLSEIDPRMYGIKEGLAPSGVTGPLPNDINLDQLITASKFLYAYWNGLNSGPVGFMPLKWATGVYVFRTMQPWSSVFGPTWRGAGEFSTVILFEQSGAALTANLFAGVKSFTFEDMSFVCGSAIERTAPDAFQGRIQINATPYGNRTKTFIDHSSPTVDDRQLKFKNVCFEGWKTCWFAGDDGNPATPQGNHSEMFWDKVTIRDCTRFAEVDCNQSVNLHFLYPVTDRVSHEVFLFRAGGFLCVTGTSHINPGVFVRYTPRLSNGSGPNNALFAFDKIKWEDGSSAAVYNFFAVYGYYPKIFVITPPSNLPGQEVGDAHVHLFLNQCEWISGTGFETNAAKRVIIDMVGANCRLTVKDSQLYGIVNLAATGSAIPSAKFIDCQIVPDVVAPINAQGSRWAVEFDNCGGTEIGNATTIYNRVLNEKRVGRYINGSIADQPSLTDFRHNAGNLVFGANVTHDFEIVIPANHMVMRGPRLNIAKTNLVALVITGYSDPARTKPIFTLTTGTDTTRHSYFASIVATISQADAICQASKIYMRVTSVNAPGKLHFSGSIETKGFGEILDPVNWP